MIGRLALVIRLLLYPLAGALVARGIISAEAEAQTVQTLAEVLAGLLVYAGTVVWSRIARLRGGET